MYDSVAQIEMKKEKKKVWKLSTSRSNQVTLSICYYSNVCPGPHAQDNF